MPVATTYPGVYIQEEPSSVHTITGVPTSVAAFIGSAPKGRVNTSVHLDSWADYVREFGGLNTTSELSYAVFLFFANGGSAAEVVRANDKAGKAKPAEIHVADDFVLRAVSPGDWANHYAVAIETDDKKALKGTFNLIIQNLDDDGNWVAAETYKQLTPGTAASSLALSNHFNLEVADPAGNPPKEPKQGMYGTDVIKSDANKHGAGGHAAGGADAGAGAPPAGGAGGAAADAKDEVNSDKSVKGVDPSTKVGDFDIPGALAALDAADIYNIVVLPHPATGGNEYDAGTLSVIAQHCQDKRAVLILDPPQAWQDDPHLSFQAASTALTDFQTGNHAACYFPNIQTVDPGSGIKTTRGPSGAIAGVWAATDAARGVWKAPAGTNARLVGISGLKTKIDDAKNGDLNQIGVNCLRTFPLVGSVVWGARTTEGADRLGSQWKYLPIRRTALFIEESLRRGTQWIVFEPNDEPLWAAIRLNVGAFMNSLFRQGAFQGSTPREAYLVKCDKENNPQNDIDRGIVNITVGFAPLKPAEFVIIHIEQLAGQLQV